MDKILVVNADDLGFSPDVNAAIEELHRGGRITNASLMVDGKHVDDALAILERNPRLGVGLHLDLCPVSGLYELPYPIMRQNLSSPQMQSNIAAETERQIVRFKELGIPFRHMDGHRHFHALPEIFSTVVEVAAQHGLKTVRMAKNWILPRTPSVYLEESFYRQATGLLQQHHILYPDHFVYGWKDYSAESFQPGLNELMVHVALEMDEYRREYDLLSSEPFWAAIRDSGVLLRSYPEVAAA